ncbi:MAG: hypothetical protein K8L99_28725 [Anaerolineae bacterium]|nr:hypothetical protein [Anaerolineae bacterium]
MAVTLKWLDPQKTRLMIAYSAGWTREALRSRIEQVSQLLNEMPRPVHIVINQQDTPIPTSEFLLHMQWLSVITRHANANQVVVAGAPVEIQRLFEGSTLGKNSTQEFHFYRTLDEAETYLSQFDFLTQLGNLDITGV